MGAEVYVYLSTGRHSFVARLDVHEEAAVNQSLRLALHMKKAHFFDPTTGRTLV
jgi:ABC-type sugar transport system ATPase subunit